MKLIPLPQLGQCPLEVFGSGNLSQSISKLQKGHFSLLSSTSVIKYKIIEAYSKNRRGFLFSNVKI